MAKQTALNARDLVVIHKYLCNELGQPGSRMTTADIYLNTKDLIESSNIESHYFRTSLSERIKDGTLAGIIIKKGRYGGVLVSDLPSAQEAIPGLEQAANAPPELVSEEATKAPVHSAVARNAHKEDAFEILLPGKMRIYPVDKRNWAVQHQTGIAESGEPVWHSLAYLNTLDEACRSAARRLLDHKLRTAAITVQDLHVVSNTVKKAAEEILNAINSLPRNPLDKSNAV
jgi:hypothetical protein